MDEEWRVNLVIHDPPVTGKKLSARAVRDLLRDRVGPEVAVSAGRSGIFLYAATADAAATAERTAQEVLAEQGLLAGIRTQRWDLSRKAWVDARTELPADADESSPGRRGLRRAGALIAAIIEGIGDAGV